MDWLSSVITPWWDNEGTRAEQMAEIGDWMVLLDSSATRVSLQRTPSADPQLMTHGTELNIYARQREAEEAMATRRKLEAAKHGNAYGPNKQT